MARVRFTEDSLEATLLAADAEATCPAPVALAHATSIPPMAAANQGIIASAHRAPGEQDTFEPGMTGRRGYKIAQPGRDVLVGSGPPIVADNNNPSVLRLTFHGCRRQMAALACAQEVH
jgi:hypothetical protein